MTSEGVQVREGRRVKKRQQAVRDLAVIYYQWYPISLTAEGCDIVYVVDVKEKTLSNPCGTLDWWQTRSYSTSTLSGLAFCSVAVKARA